MLLRFHHLDRVRNEEVLRRAGIERELACRADQRVLRWFGHVETMDEYCMARSVLLAQVSAGTRKTEVRLDGLYEGGLGQQRNDGGGRARMRKRSERVESPSTYVIKCVSRRHFYVALCSFERPSLALVIITWRGVGCRYMMRLG